MAPSKILSIWILMRIFCRRVLSHNATRNWPSTPKYQYKVTTFYPIVLQKLSFMDSNTACKQKNQQLPLPQSTKEQMKLLNLMKETGMNTTWLRTVWEISKHWQLVSGARYDGEVVQTVPDHYCGALGNSAVSARNCFGKLDGFICQMKGDKCKAFDKGECVTFSNETTTWFEADMKCGILGGSLLFDEDLIKNLHKPTQGRDYHWIGVTQVKSRLQWTNWRSGVQRDRNSSCGVVNGNDGYWDPVPCHEYHPFVCLKGNEPASSGIIRIVLLGCVGICTIVVLPFAVFRCMSYRCKDKPSSQPRMNWKTDSDNPADNAPSEHPNMWSEYPGSPQNKQLSMDHLDEEDVYYGTPIDAITSEFSCGPAPLGFVKNNEIRY